MSSDPGSPGTVMSRLPVPIVEEGGLIAAGGNGLRVSFVCVMRRGYASLHAVSESFQAVGSLKWGTDSDGEVTGVYVVPEWRRRGLGSLLWKVATELSEENEWPPPRHATPRSEAGDGFARAVGGEVPPLDGGVFAAEDDDGFERVPT
jgi:GNAT superfamily N-acetyltransferase